MENKLMCRIDHLSDKCDILQCDVDAMQDICDSVKEENEQLHNRVHTLEGQLDVVENQNRKSNLLFFGIPTTASEVWSDSEKKVCDFIKNDMGISDLVVGFAHWVGKAIMVRFQSIKAKEQVLIQARRLKHSSVYVREDFSPAVRKKRNALQPLLRSLRDDGKRAYLRFDRVVWEGTSYTFDVEQRQYSNSQNRDRPGIPRVILQKGVRGQATVSSCLMEAATGPDIERSVALTRAPVVRAIGREVWGGGGFSHHPSGNRNLARPS
ncbi:hypothetical protein ACOMHN_062885 [Nucella lapillus]